MLLAPPGVPRWYWRTISCALLLGLGSCRALSAALFYLKGTIALGSGNVYWLHFTDEETEAQRGEMTSQGHTASSGRAERGRGGVGMTLSPRRRGSVQRSREEGGA